MNILYLSCHAVLEFDEVKLLTELGHNVLSLGSYLNTENPHDKKRPGFAGFYDDHLLSVALQFSKENLHEELIEWADLILVMHRHDWILNNWQKIKGKRVVWRTIGQSTPAIESALAIPQKQGLQIVRYSRAEENIPGYIGANAYIYFYKDPDEFKDWNGSINEVMTVAQSMKRRGDFCGFKLFAQATEGQDRKLFGPDNEDSGIKGGQLTYDELKAAYRNYRVYFYTGTYPASYTLNFIEALMTGIPVVAIGRQMADLGYYGPSLYEVASIINNGTNGYVSNSMDELKTYVRVLMNDLSRAQEIGVNGRKTAIDYFGKENIKKQWQEFL